MPGLFYTNRYTNALGKGVLHRGGRLVPHVRKHVGVGVEGYGYRRMAQHLRDYFRVHIPGQQERGARVPEVVEADGWKPGALEEWLEAMASDRAPVEWGTRLRGEYEAVLLPEGARPVYHLP